MVEITKTVDSSDGVKIFYRVFNSDNAIANLLIIHGLGDHSGRMQPFMSDQFVRAGFNVYALDQRGHGESGGPTMHSPSIQQSLEDFQAVQNEIVNKSLPTFIYGHSFGGCMTLHYTLLHKDTIAGCVVTAPLIHNTVKVPGAKVFFGNLFSKVSATSLVDTGVNINHTSRVPEVVKSFKTDPKCHKKISLAMGSWMLDKSEELLKLAPMFSTPLLIVHPTTDKICCPKAAHQFYEKAASTDKTFKYWDEVYHELYTEVEGPQIIQYIADWLISKVNSNSTHPQQPISTQPPTPITN